METKDWQVSYFNATSRRRYVMLDNLTEQEADAMMAKFGNPKDTYFYMNDARKEKMPTEVSA